MSSSMIPRILIFIASVISTINVHAAGVASLHQSLADAIVCKSKLADAVSDLVKKGSDFKLGYAAYGFGEGTGYKALVILNEPLVLYSATASAVVSETEHSYFNFSAFTYAQFKGDYRQVVKALNLQAVNPMTETSLGKFVSRQPSGNSCPETISLTPTDEGRFLLGCGWCNGG